MRRESPADNLPGKIFPQKFCSFGKIWHTEDANYLERPHPTSVGWGRSSIYEMAICTLPFAVEEVKTESVGFTTKPGVTFASIVEENKKKNEKINTEKKI